MFFHFLIALFFLFSNWISSVQIGYINDVILFSPTASVVPTNGSCAKCICLMLLATDILGITCSQSQTCLLFHNYSLPYSLNDRPNSTFYFLSLPPEQEYSTYQSSQGSQMILSTAPTIMSISSNAFWSFDNNLLDLYNNFNANPFGNPTYTTSYLSTGAALSLTRTSSQYAADMYTQLLFNSTSFTIEVWIYPISLTADDYGIFGQCQANASNLCMFFIIRNLKIYCGFTNNDISGNTIITMNIWSHVACVYDLASMTQQVWLNGVLDGSRSSPAYQGSLANTTIGVTYLKPSGSNFFNGYLDQMQFSLRAKNATEILNDATLVVYYSFDGGSLYDNGPNGINATLIGTVTTVFGRVNEAVRFNSSSNSYISPSYRAFYMMGVSNQPFTIALWVQPVNALETSTIVFVSSSSTGWCVGYVATQSNGQITVNLWSGSTTGSAPGPILSLNTWTHIGYTYSHINGLRLYINGTLYSTSGTFSLGASGTPNYVTIGSNRGQSYCAPSYGGQFNGAVDEFYVYCRELTAAEIWTLANP